MPGMTTTAGISGSLSSADLVSQVLQQGIELSNLSSILGQANVPNLTGTIPISKSGSVVEDLEELETSDIEGGSFTYVTFDLKKDRVKLAVSDEATYKSRAGSPLDIQISSSGMELANILDKKGVAALQTDPQTTAAVKKWDTVTNSIFYDIGAAVVGCRPYRADFIVMPSAVYNAYLGNDSLKYMSAGTPPVLAGAVSRVPGLNLDIFVDDRITEKSFIVGASRFAAILGKGPVKVRTTDDVDAGATVYQMDVWRQVKAPIFKNAAGKNMAAFQITAVIT